jgi:PTS system N-acetylglucosamine-specific IIC component
LAVVFGLGWPVIEQGMDQLSYAVAESGKAGLFVYGILNRFLIATGLHHILNNVAWFIIGDFNGATGDLKRFFAGDPSAGAFMSGFFPVMMFGLPAACLAMYHTALPERKKETAGLLLSMALTSFLTGVTEPIEFTFMFLAPLLFALHAFLTGTAMVVMDLLQTRLGFGFSAGLFDYLLNYKLAEKPLMLLPVGALYFALYYGLFRFFIQRFNILTPGRDALIQKPQSVSVTKDDAGKAIAFIRALGGPDNLQSVDACTTRLRLQVASLAAVNEPELKALGAIGVVTLGQHGLQVVLGPVADQVAGDIRAQWQSHSKPPVTDAESQELSSRHLPESWNMALGGKANILSAHVKAGRIMVRLVNAGQIDNAALQRLGVKAHGHSGQGTLHLLHDEALGLIVK